MAPTSVAALMDTPASLRVRRLLSWTGTLPLGAFLLLHVVVDSPALFGPQAFARGADRIGRFPGAGALEAILVYAPLLTHGLLGAWLTVRRQPLSRPSAYPPGFSLAMRVTGIASLGFIALHYPELRASAPGSGLGGGELATLNTARLSTTWAGVPLIALGYLAGVGAVVFHFAVGAWGAWASLRGPHVSPASLRRGAWVAAGLGAVLCLLYANLIVFRATGAPLFGPGASSEGGSSGPCPPKSD